MSTNDIQTIIREWLAMPAKAGKGFADDLRCAAMEIQETDASVTVADFIAAAEGITEFRIGRQNARSCWHDVRRQMEKEATA